MPSDTGVLACIGLGANLGDTDATLAAACAALQALPDTEWVAVSGAWRSRPVDADGPDYRNAVACVRTRLTPHGLLQALQGIEQAHGRERPYRNAPRTLDLDVLLYGDLRCADAVLTVPHPCWTERAFVLLPLLQLQEQLQEQLPGQGANALVLPGEWSRDQWQRHAQQLALQQGLEPVGPITKHVCSP